MFQSTPAIAGGRIRGRSRPHGRHHRVSIHARHCWRANPHTLRFPVIGRVVSIHARHCWRANPLTRVEDLKDYEVSIHARHCWRANPWQGGNCWLWPACFNPRPPLLAGESLGFDAQRTTITVSIHARHCWRANRSPWGATPCAWPFQSTPAIAGGRIRLTPCALPTGITFQSTPAIAGGRIRPAPWSIALTSWFQSTPAIAGGRIRARWDAEQLAYLVSIHARHCWRANPGQHLHILALDRVSIHARHCWRANPQPQHRHAVFHDVSIHARHCWRANPLCT